LLFKKTIVILLASFFINYAAQAKDLHYAGFFLQSHEDLEKELPYSSKAFHPDLNNKNYSRISDFFESIVDQAKNPNYSISKSMGTITKGDALAFGVALTSEDIDIIDSGRSKNIQINLRFNIICFDFVDKVLLYNVPIRQAITSKITDLPSESKIVEIILENLFKDGDQSNSAEIFKELKQSGEELASLYERRNVTEGKSLRSEILSKIEKIPENFQRLRVGIDQIIIDDAIKETFPKGFDYQLYKFALAQRFESALSKNDIALIPYSSGEINDRKLGLISKFKDAPNINHEKLKLPEPDKVFILKVDKIISNEKKLDDNYRLRKVVASKYTFKFIEPYGNELLFDSSFYTSRTFRYGKNQKHLYENEHLLMIYKILESYLFFQFSDLLKNPDENKIKEISKDADADMLKKLYMEITQ
jgi:hypothetical protein